MVEKTLNNLLPSQPTAQIWSLGFCLSLPPLWPSDPFLLFAKRNSHVQFQNFALAFSRAQNVLSFIPHLLWFSDENVTFSVRPPLTILF